MFYAPTMCDSMLWLIPAALFFSILIAPFVWPRMIAPSAYSGRFTLRRLGNLIAPGCALALVSCITRSDELLAGVAVALIFALFFIFYLSLLRYRWRFL